MQKHNILLLMMLSAMGTRVAEWWECSLPTNHFAIGRWLILLNRTNFFGEKSKLKLSGVSLFWNMHKNFE